MQHRLVAGRPQLTAEPLPVLVLVGASWATMLVLTSLGGGALIRHDRLLQGGPPLWVATLTFLGGWQLMLWAMMVVPAFAAVRQRASGIARAWFLTSYLGLWTAFGLGVLFLDLGVHAAVKHSPWLQLHPWVIGGALLVLTGVYQLSRLKAVSLEGHRAFITARPGLAATRRADELRAGVGYGVRCLGANWALMLLVFAVAASSLVIMAAITILMVWESAGRPWISLTRIAGYVLIATGAALLPGPVLGPFWIA